MDMKTRFNDADANYWCPHRYQCADVPESREKQTPIIVFDQFILAYNLIYQH
jgi:hypothetical protein